MKINQEKNDNKLIIKLDGELDSVQAKVLEEKVSNIDSDVKEIILDLEKLEYISSAGIRIFLLINRTMDERNGSMKIIKVNDTVYEILKLASLIEYLKIERI